MRGDGPGHDSARPDDVEVQLGWRVLADEVEVVGGQAQLAGWFQDVDLGRIQRSAARSGHRAAAVRHVDAEHREPEDGRLEDRLLVDAADVRSRGEIRALCVHERLADGDGRAVLSRAKLLGEVAVQPLGVLEELGVTVLVAGAADEHGALPGEGLRPVER